MLERLKRSGRLLVFTLAPVLSACDREARTPAENYTVILPGTNVKFEMVYVRGGEFDMGSPESEPGRELDEGPVRRVRLRPYWIGRTEVTWEQYERYAFAVDPLMLDAVSLASPMIDRAWGLRLVAWFKLKARLAANRDLDAVTRPTLYEGDYYHGMGRGDKPVVGVSRLGAEMFCDWLSRKTGDRYRLPTEAEWEYAARAGCGAAYPFGDNPGGLGRFAWYGANSGFQTYPVGSKEPNAFGIHDMLGNVWEYCLDYYAGDYFRRLDDFSVNLDPRGLRRGKGRKAVLRGGGWNDFAVDLRVANRLELPDRWNERDTRRPRGVWWLVDGTAAGFRVARPLE